MPDETLTKLIQNRQFIFGLSLNDRSPSTPASTSEYTSQVWSLGFQGRLESDLLRAEKAATAPDKNRCPGLDEKKELEDAVAANPSVAASLISLAQFHERLSPWNDEERFNANEFYRKAIQSDGTNESLEGYIRTIGSEDAAWSAGALFVEGCFEERPK